VPFTPFHMGPGLLLKALLRGGFSLMVFGWAQIVIDVEPLVVLLTGGARLHGFTHSYARATCSASLPDSPRGSHRAQVDVGRTGPRVGPNDGGDALPKARRSGQHGPVRTGWPRVPRRRAREVP